MTRLNPLGWGGIPPSAGQTVAPSILNYTTWFLPSTSFHTFSLSDYDREFLLLVIFLGVVSPDAVVERGDKAQPGHVGHNEQKCSATDGIPRNHGGHNGPSDEDNINEGLYWAETGCYMDNHLLHHPRLLQLLKWSTHFILCAPKKRTGHAQLRASCSP